ncbi:MAG: NTP transferase domain-containing protein [Candidatus Glassbacteria bacterium]|nr:NTP transferase domain-containing protein [Candidatus Glassbacteria bacterium]
MKALIIAAGKGSRFNGLSSKEHKALLEVCGRTVVERILDALPQVDELVVVTGYRAERLERDLQDLLARRVRLSFVRIRDWDRGNGLSVLAARQALEAEERFLLLMSDHLVEPALIRRLCLDPPGPGECLLAVDRDVEGVFDLEDATKVLLGDERRIEAIGKDLTEYNALDTGVFYCTPVLFDALEEAAAAGGESLSHGIRVLCGRRAMGYRDVSGCLWQDIDSPECVAEAEKRLWNRVQKPRDGVVSRLFNRKVSGWITRRICRLPVKPDQVTVFNVLLAGLAAWLMATGHLLSGAVAAQLYSIVDGVDGELARLKNMGSWAGGWLDNICDRLCDWMLIIGAACAARFLGAGDTFFWVLLTAALVSNLAYWTAMDSLLVSGVLRAPAGERGDLAELEAWFYQRGMVFGLTHDCYILILAVGVASGFPAYTLWLLIALETLWWTAKLSQVRNAEPSAIYVDYLAGKNV